MVTFVWSGILSVLVFCTTMDMVARVTFSWGCAIEASAMVDRVFKRPQIYLSKLQPFFIFSCFRNLWAHFHLLVGDRSWISCVIGGYWMNRECYLCTVHFIYQRKTKLISLFKWNLCNTVWNSVRSKYWIKVIFGKLFIYLFCRMAGADPTEFHYDSNCQNWSTCNSCAQFQT